MRKLAILLLVFVLFLSGCQPNAPNADEPSNQGAGSSEGTNDKEVPKENDIDNEGSKESGENSGGSEEGSEEADEDSQDTGSADTSNYDDIKVSAQEAFDVFMDKYPNAKINEIELELEDGGYEYKIEGYGDDTEYELEIDAFTKEILEAEEDTESGETGEIKRDQLENIKKYVDEALEDAGPEYWVKEWELKAKTDYIKLDIELKTDDRAKLKYKYDYETGELLDKK